MRYDTRFKGRSSKTPNKWQNYERRTYWLSSIVLFVKLLIKSSETSRGLFNQSRRCSTNITGLFMRWTALHLFIDIRDTIGNLNHTKRLRHIWCCAKRWYEPNRNMQNDNSVAIACILFLPKQKSHLFVYIIVITYRKGQIFVSLNLFVIIK